MPWIDRKDCTYCGTCIHECPAGAISGHRTHAVINQDRCIRCGLCHSVCTAGAVKHDSLRMDEEVAGNLDMTRRHMDECAAGLGHPDEKRKSLQRHIRYYRLQKKIADRTVAKLEALSV